MPREELIVDGHVLDCYSGHALLVFDDAIHKQKGKSAGRSMRNWDGFAHRGITNPTGLSAIGIPHRALLLRYPTASGHDSKGREIANERRIRRNDVFEELAAL